MKVELIDEGDSPLTLNSLTQFVNFIEAELIKKQILKTALDKTLNIIFLPASSIKDLNSTYLKKNYVTDILSFAPTDEGHLGELALCEEKIISQAKDSKHSLEAEIFYLILHGILHLLGFHHEESKKEAKKMYQIQDSLFEEWRKQLTH